MKTFRKPVIVLMAVAMAVGLASCTDANEYDDANTDNPSWSDASHPESLANTKYVRTSGIKTNAYGEDVQGFVESLTFVSADSVSVKMSEGATQGEWTDESNTDRVPLYEYTYNTADGKIEIKKTVKDDNGKVSKTVIFTGTALSSNRELITIVHFGDTPAQTYLVKQ